MRWIEMKGRIPDERIRFLNSKATRDGEYVLYWMQSSHRTQYNLALEYAIERANRLGKPVVVFFGLTSKLL